MEFIDNPQFGHKYFKLPVFLVPFLMFLILFLVIYVSRVYVVSVLEALSWKEIIYRDFLSLFSSYG